MKQPLWIIVSVVVGFLAFMLGYAVPPFMEVGFGGEEKAAEQQAAPAVDDALLQHYKDLYKQEE